MNNNPTTKLNAYTTENVIVIEMDGNFQQNDSDELEELLFSFYEDQKRNIIIDLQKADNICSTALGLLVRFKSLLNEQGGDIKMVISTPQVAELFKVTMMDTVFDTMDTLQEAVHAF